MTTYTGKYPNRIRSVFFQDGCFYITTNDRKQYTVVAKKKSDKVPSIGREISEYGVTVERVQAA